MDTKPPIVRKIKIAFIGQKGIPLKFGGIEAYVENVVERLPKDRFDVSVYVRPWYTPQILKEYKGARLVHIPCIQTKYLDAFTHVLLSSIHCLFKDFDIIHYQGIGPSFFCGIPKLFGKKVVLTIHGLPQLSSKWSPFGKFFLHISERIGISFADKVIVISKTLQKGISNKQKNPPVYIPNSIEIDLEQNVLDRIIKKYNLKGNDYILFLGRISPEKRIEWLIQAFKEIGDQFPIKNMKLVIAGAAQAGDAYEMRIKKMCEGDSRMLFTEWVSGREKKELLSNATVFVLPSYLEGLPTALLEAMSYKIPCIVSDIPSHQEVIRDKKNGFLFDCLEFDQLKVRLQEVCSVEPAILKTIGEAAHETVKQRYNLDTAIQQLCDVYRAVKQKKGLKLCLVSSSGGHLYQLYVLKSFWEKYQRVWVTFKKTDAESLLKGEKSYWAYFPTTRSIKAFFFNFFLACHVLRKEKPDIIISTGAGVAVPFFLLAKFFRVKLVYIEVFDRITSATLTGKLVYPLCDKFVVQWEEQKRFYPKGILLGQVL